MSARLSSGGRGEVVGGVKVGVGSAVGTGVLITGVGVEGGDPVVGLGLGAVLAVGVVDPVMVVVDLEVLVLFLARLRHLP